MKASEVKRKNVVRMSDGSIVGNIADFEFNPSTYQIEAVCVQEKLSLIQSLLHLFVKEQVIVVDISKIVQIGNDVVFADFSSSEKR